MKKKKKLFNTEFYSVKNPKGMSKKLSDKYDSICSNNECESKELAFFEHKGVLVVLADKRSYRRVHQGYNRWAAYAVYKPYGYNYPSKLGNVLNLGTWGGEETHVLGLTEEHLHPITKEEFCKVIGIEQKDCTNKKIFYQWK